MTVCCVPRRLLTASSLYDPIAPPLPDSRLQAEAVLKLLLRRNNKVLATGPIRLTTSPETGGGGAVGKDPTGEGQALLPAEQINGAPTYSTAILALMRPSHTHQTTAHSTPQATAHTQHTVHHRPRHTHSTHAARTQVSAGGRAYRPWT